MARIAILCPPYFSHVRLFEVLGEALVARKHSVHFITNAGGERLVESRQVTAHSVPARTGDPSPEQVLRNAERPTGLTGVLRTIADSARLTDQLCAGAPALFDRLGIDAVVGDQFEPAAFLLAAHRRLPVVAVAAALPINRAPGLPLPFLDWPYDPSPAGVKRAAGGDRVADWLSRAHHEVVASWARRWGLPNWRTLHDCLPLVQLSQVIAAFDFPRPEPSPVQAVGPIRRPRAEPGVVPFTPDPTRPFVFASLGTVQGHRWRLFRAMTKAVHAAGGQIFVGHCGKMTQREERFVGADFTADFVPQAEALALADLTICHAGLNTVLDSLAAGVPVLAHPIAFDQKGSTARLIHHRLGERMETRQSALNAQVARMLRDVALKARVAAVARTVPDGGGADRAVSLIEGVIGAA
jgi:zeaxanthin glucosyltransferase